MYSWPWQGIDLYWFHPDEFDHPELMDGEFMLAIDDLRAFCGFALYVTGDGRTAEEHYEIYRDEIEDPSHWRTEPPDSAHPKGLAIDIKMPKPMNRIVLVDEVTTMCRTGRLPYLGLEIATRHIHIEDYNNPSYDRPTVWAGKSY